MMRKAIIDLGTNTFNILICDVYDYTFVPVFKKTIGVKMGQGGINQGLIMPEAFERGIQALIQCKSFIDQHQPIQMTHAIATSAVRSAKNGQEFVETAFAKTGIRIDVINGLREAELIYKGVIRSLPPTLTENFVMMDIGGGSTEFIIGNQTQIIWRNSYTLGIARLMEKFNPSNPIKPSEINNINTYFKETLSDCLNQIKNHNINTLIGVAGSFESYAEMIAEQVYKKSQNPDYKSLEILVKDTRVIHQNLLPSTYEERMIMKGLLPLRADMMVMSSLLIQFVLQNANIKTLWVSSYSLKEGLIFEV